MSGEIENIGLKFSCQQNWNEMQPVDGGKFCKKCSKKIYDFTNAKENEFRAILAENSGLCGMFRTDQVGSVGIKLPLWKKWISAAVLLIGINIFNKAEAQATSSTKDTIRNTVVTEDPKKIFGSVENSAEFPGGREKFQKFIIKNLSYSGDKTGKVIVQFIVNEEGTISDIKVLRRISPEADKEAVRVLSISPKWKPGIRYGKPVKQQYTVPITWSPVK